jgi:hypothetical protein
MMDKDQYFNRNHDFCLELYTLRIALFLPAKINGDEP